MSFKAGLNLLASMVFLNHFFQRQHFSLRFCHIFIINTHRICPCGMIMNNQHIFPGIYTCLSNNLVFSSITSVKTDMLIISRKLKLICAHYKDTDCVIIINVFVSRLGLLHDQHWAIFRHNNKLAMGLWVGLQLADVWLVKK